MTAKKAAKNADAAEVTEKKTTKAAAAATDSAATASEPKKRGRKPKAATEAAAGAKTAKKETKKASFDEDDVGDIEAELEGELDANEAEATAEAGAAGDDKPKAKPLRMKVSRAKERALMREFGIDDTTLTVPAGEVVAFDTASIAGVPDGAHGVVVSTLASDSIVVERVLTQPAGDGVATTVVLGAQTSALSGRWHAVTSTELAIEDVIVVLNTSFSEGVVVVKAIGPGGEVPVPGLEEIPLPANGIVSVDLTSPLAFGRSLVVESQLPVIVERRLERDPNLRGRSGSLAIPE